jgi:hypothetical protein
MLVASDAVAQSLTVAPGTQPKGGWRTWWACDVSGLDPARPLELTVKDSVTACGRTPVISRDSGLTWTHLVARSLIGAATVRLAWYVPYTLADAQASIAAAVTVRPALRAGTLTTSEGGRPVPMLSGCTPGKPVVWIQARQHAWECATRFFRLRKICTRLKPPTWNSRVPGSTVSQAQFDGAVRCGFLYCYRAVL